jgi:hypothetical protein
MVLSVNASCACSAVAYSLPPLQLHAPTASRMHYRTVTMLAQHYSHLTKHIPLTNVYLTLMHYIHATAATAVAAGTVEQ